MLQNTEVGDVAQLVRASDRHAAESGSIPRCGKGFFSQSHLSMQTLLRVSVHPRVQLHALTSVRTLKILQSMSDLSGIMETLKHPACTVGWVARRCRSWLSPGNATRISHGKIPLEQYSCTKLFFFLVLISVHCTETFKSPADNKEPLNTYNVKHS